MAYMCKMKPIFWFFFFSFKKSEFFLNCFFFFFFFEKQNLILQVTEENACMAKDLKAPLVEIHNKVKNSLFIFKHCLFLGGNPI